MKSLLRSLCSFAAILLCVFAPLREASGQLTGLSWGPLYLTSGQPITNQYSVQAWPPSQQWVVIGTNLVWEGAIYTNQPNIMANQLTPGPAGYFTNQLYPGFYAVKVPALGNSVLFYLNVPSASLQLPISSCATNVPVFIVNASGFTYITGLLGYVPPTNSLFGITQALQYTPQPASTALTNLTAGTTICVTNQGVVTFIASDGSFWRSNQVTGQWVYSSSNLVQSIDGVTQPTNPFYAYAPTNVLSFSATNELSPTNLPPFQGDVSAPGRSNTLTLISVAPGNAAGASAKISYDAKGRIIGTNSLTMADLPPLTMVGNTNSVYSVVTNGSGTVWMTINTNGNPGTFGNTLPNGSFATTTNGQAFQLTTTGWMQLVPNYGSGFTLGLLTLNAGYVSETNTVWPPAGIPPYTGTMTNFLYANSNGWACKLWTNNGAGTIGIEYLP